MSFRSTFSVVIIVVGSWCLSPGAIERGLAEEPEFLAYSEPLPTGAIARLGSSHLRVARYIESLTYSPDGKFLIGGGFDGTIYVWDSHTGQLHHRFTIGKHPKLYFSANGSQLIVQADSGLHRWRIPKFEPVEEPKSIAGRDAAAAKLAKVRGKSLYLTTDRKTKSIVVRQVATNKEVARTPRGMFGFRPTLSPDEQLLLVLHRSVDPKDPQKRIHPVLIWGTTGNKQLFDLSGHASTVKKLAITSDSKHLFTVSKSYRKHSVFLWDLTTGKQLDSFAAESRGDLSVHVSPDDRQLLVQSLMQAELFDITTRRSIRVSEGLGSPGAVAFSPDGETIAFGSSGGVVRLFDIATGKERLPHSGYSTSVHSLAISADGRYVTSWGRVWDAGKKKVVYRVDSTKLRRFPLLMRAGEHFAITGMSGDHLLSLDKDGWVFKPLLLPRKRQCGIAFSQDGKRVLIGIPKALQVWDQTTGKQLHNLPTATDCSVAVAMSPQGDYVAAGGDGITIWNLKDPTQSPRLIPKQQTGKVQTLMFSPDGTLLASGGTKKDVSLWNTKTFGLVREIDTRRALHTHKITFTADGRHLMAFNGTGIGHNVPQKALTFWEVATGHKRAIFQPPFGTTSYDVSADGKRLATGNYDGTMMVWEMDQISVEIVERP